MCSYFTLRNSENTDFPESLRVAAYPVEGWPLCTHYFGSLLKQSGCSLHGGAMPQCNHVTFPLFLKQLVVFSLRYRYCNNWLHLNWWSLFLIIRQHVWGTLLCWLCAYFCSPSLPGVYLLGGILIFLCHYNLNFLLFFISQWSEGLQKDIKERHKNSSF